jgi:hypothetical protein
MTRPKSAAPGFGLPHRFRTAAVHWRAPKERLAGHQFTVKAAASPFPRGARRPLDGRLQALPEICPARFAGDRCRMRRRPV